jgi:hypothetical protein
VRHFHPPTFPTCALDAPAGNYSPSLACHASGNRSVATALTGDPQRCDYGVSGNQLQQTNFVHCNTTRARREEICAHGPATTPTIWHTTGETTPEVDQAGTGGDRRRLRPERGRVEAPRADAAGIGSRADRPLPTATIGIGSTLRDQALAELLNDLSEYRAASHPALRAFWRKLALHDVHAFRRDYLIPERAAFGAAVARSQARRAA